MVFLSLELIETIESHYEKSRQSESYKVHRVLKNKLDDLATDLRTHVTESSGTTTAATLSITSDLAAVARCAVTSKDAPQSLRYLWTGRPGHAEKKRREKETLWSDGEHDREDKERNKDREKDIPVKEGKDKDGRDRERDREARSCDEGDRPWGGRMQRKIESWAGCVILSLEESVIAEQYSRGVSNRLGKGKKLSVDFGTLGKAFLPESPRGPSEKSGQSSMVPSVVVSRFVVFIAFRHRVCHSVDYATSATPWTRKNSSAVANSLQPVRIYNPTQRYGSEQRSYPIDSRWAQPIHAGR